MFCDLACLVAGAAISGDEATALAHCAPGPHLTNDYGRMDIKDVMYVRMPPAP